MNEAGGRVPAGEGGTGVPHPGYVEGELTASDGVRLFRRGWLAPEPRGTIALVHGLGDHAGRYDLTARAMTDAGLSFLAYDQRGHGRSPGRRGDAPGIGTLVEDLKLFVETVVEESTPDLPVYLMGHSMGGLIALRYLQTSGGDIPRAVVSAPWLGSGTVVPSWMVTLGRLVGRVLPRVSLGTSVDPSVLTRDPERIRVHEGDRLSHARMSPRLFESVETAQAAAFAQAGALATPCLFAIPLADRLVDPEATRRLVSGLTPGLHRAFEIPGGRHEPWNDLGRDALFHEIADWLLEGSNP